jgi:glyoxylase-like metal-dependent hydrolase (beta-lactamase superfamily II)
MPDSGSARCDFPGGDARELYRSVQKLYALPPETRVFVCHDYCPGGREARCQTTIAEQRASNTHLRDGIDETAYVKLRTDRDANARRAEPPDPVRAGQHPRWSPAAGGGRGQSVSCACR